MERISYEFNNKIRFPQGSVNKTIFSTTGYKKVTCIGSGFEKEAIAKLNIPTGSIIIRSKTGGLRTNKVLVERIEDMDGEIIDESEYHCTGYIYRGISYSTGKITKPLESLDVDVNRTCTTGIHFYLTEKEAEKY